MLLILKKEHYCFDTTIDVFLVRDTNPIVVLQQVIYLFCYQVQNTVCKSNGFSNVAILSPEMAANYENGVAKIYVA